MSFDGLIGNDKTKEILSYSVQNKNILHSYLFYGTEGIGKKLFAIEFSKMILCESDSENKPCNKCKACIEFESNNNPDFTIIEPDNNSIKIEQIRALQKKIIEKPINGSKKIYIINDADKMTKEAQNCLLKTLEEPQSFVVIIMICSNENAILPTVKSRCTKIFFNEHSREDIRKFMEEKNSTTNIDESMVELCSGSIKKSIEVIEKEEKLNQLKDIIHSVDKVNKLKFISQNEFFYTNKDDVNLILDYIYVLLYKKVNNSNLGAVVNAMSYVEEAKNKLKYSNNYDMTIDNMLIKIWEEFNEKNNRSQV